MEDEINFMPDESPKKQTSKDYCREDLSEYHLDDWPCPPAVMMETYEQILWNF